MIRTSSYINVLTLVIDILLTMVQSTVSLDEMEAPLVYFEGYQNGDTGDWRKTGGFSDVMIWEGNDFSVVDPIVTRILIRCQASYPIQWEMTDVQTKSLGKFFTHSKVIYEEAGGNFTFQEFHSYLDLFNTPSLTGEYKCRSIPDKEKEISIYVFLPGTGKEQRSFSFPGKEMVVGSTRSKGEQDSFLLPCKVTRKELGVYLAIYQNETMTWNSHSLNTTFDPKKGFRLFVSADDRGGVIGKRFKCAVPTSEEGEEEDSLIVDVMDGEHNVDLSFPFLNLVDGNATWKPKENRLGVECCSNSTTPPSMIGALCENKPHCDMVKKVFMLNSNRKMKGTPGLAPTAKSHSQVSCRASAMVIGRPLLLLCVGDGINFSGEITNQLVSPFDTGMNEMKYMATDPTESYSPSSGNTVKILGMKVDEVFETVRKMDLQREHIYEGDKLVLDCCGLVQYHALGRIQRIGWENGTLTRIPTPETFQNDTEEPYPEDFCFRYVYNTDELEPFILTADVKMRYFECMVPVWNSVQPVIKRIELNIHAVSPPIWANNETGINVTYDENQVGILKLDCGLQSGDPVPKMKWMKDGEKLDLTDKHISFIKDDDPKKIQAYGTGLLFMRAAIAIQGNYECIAENKAGKLEKSFHVEVKPRSYLDYWVALGVFGSFFLIISCCALRVSTLDKPSFSKKINPEI